jgi:hypothetical protein
MRGLVRPLVRSIYRTFIYTPFVPIPSLSSLRPFVGISWPFLQGPLPGFLSGSCPVLAWLLARILARLRSGALPPCHPERSEGSIRRTSYPAAAVCTENRPLRALSLYIQMRNRPLAALPATVCTEKRPSRALSLYIQNCNRPLCRKIGLFGCLRARNTPFWCSSSGTGAPGQGKSAPVASAKNRNRLKKMTIFICFSRFVKKSTEKIYVLTDSIGKIDILL